MLNPHQKRHWQSFAMALGLELSLAVVVIGGVWQHMPMTPAEVIPLYMDVLMATPLEKPAQPTPISKPVVQSNAQTTPRPQQEAPQPMTPQAVPSESQVVSTVAKESAPPSAPVLAAPMATSSVDPALAYNVKLAAAVQAAFHVPGSAKALSFKGKARMEFVLHDGVASAIRVVQSSGLGAVDRAAIKAVESAMFPLPPAELKNKVGTYQIWVACF